MKTAVYLQFTNPGAYPPLIHSSDLLLEADWRVEFLGIQSRGASCSIVMPEREGRRVHILPWVEPGLRQKLHYLRFVLWVVGHCMKQRPDLIYCSDPFSCLPGMLLRRMGFRVLYHEHDSPAPGEEDNLFGPVARARHWLLRNASLVVFPNAKRLERARQWAGGMAESKVVWNCPRADEIARGEDIGDPSQPDHLRLYYHGTLVPDRLPLTILDALSRAGNRVEFTLVGYTTKGAEHYDTELKEYADRLGISKRLHLLGALKRSDIMKKCCEHDAGLVLFTGEQWQVYAEEMAGASNKAFDYLSQGLAVIVPDTPEWRSLYVDTGCGVTADPNDTERLAALFDHLARHPEQVRAMGQRGRERVSLEWNYERQFEPVMEWLNDALQNG